MLDIYEQSYDLDIINKLINKINNSEYKIIITDLVKEEIEENRSLRISKILKNINENYLKKPNGIFYNINKIPNIIRIYNDDFNEICNLVKDLQKTNEQLIKEFEKLLKKVKEDAISNKLTIDSIIYKILDSGIPINVINNETIIEKAKKRKALGLPPGVKDRNLNDQINWLALLENKEINDIFYIISNDNSFKSHINEKQLNPYLKNEWEKYHKNCEIIFHTSIYEFLDYIGLKVKEIYIKKLTESKSFYETHQLIWTLNKFIDNFDRNDVNIIIKACIENNQINWILGDSDIFDFFNNLVKKYSSIIEDELKSKIEDMLENKIIEKLMKG